MKVLELFAGTRSISKAFEARGHETFSIEWDKQHPNIDWYADIGAITTQDILDKFGVPDVIWASPDCFTKGTLVNVKDGYKPIEEIKIGDEVLTHTGELKKVYNCITKYTNEIYKLKISGCEEFEVTGNHPFYARKKKRINTHKNGEPLVYTEMEEPEWIEAKDLTNEYRVGIVINNESKLPQWNGVKKIYKNQNGYYKEYYTNELEVLFDDVNFWWMMGRYLGDGCNSYRDDKNKYQFEICCNKNNNEADEIKQVLDKLPFNYALSEKRTTNVFSINKKELCYFATKFGKGAEGKYIPQFVLDLPKDLLKSFIDGYLSADGHLDKNYNCWTITTVSEKLAYSLQMAILKAYNRYCSLAIKDAYIGEIEGRTVNCRKSYRLGFYLEKTNRLQYVIEDGYAWVNIRRNEKENKDTEVFTLSVEDNESYCVRNIIVHNCTSYSIAAISKHRTKETDGNLAPKSDYAKFCDKVNKHVIEMINEFLKINPNMIYFIENPRGGMRKMNFMKDLPRYTVTYCQYGDNRMKPTDLWTNHPNPQFKPMCKNGDPCHEAAPRGSRTGTQGLKGAKERSRIPKLLCEHIVDICEEKYL